MKKTIYYIAMALLSVACANDDSTLDMKGMFSPNGEVVNERFVQSMAYNDYAGDIHLDMQADDYTVYVCRNPQNTHVSILYT